MNPNENPARAVGRDAADEHAGDVFVAASWASSPLRPGPRQRPGLVVRHRHENHPSHAGTSTLCLAVVGVWGSVGTERDAQDGGFEVVEEKLDHRRRLAGVAEFMRELSDTDRDVIALNAWGLAQLSRDRASPRGRGRGVACALVLWASRPRGRLRELLAANGEVLGGRGNSPVRRGRTMDELEWLKG